MPPDNQPKDKYSAFIWTPKSICLLDFWPEVSSLADIKLTDYFQTKICLEDIWLKDTYVHQRFEKHTFCQETNVMQTFHLKTYMQQSFWATCLLYMNFCQRRHLPVYIWLTDFCSTNICFCKYIGHLSNTHLENIHVSITHIANRHMANRLLTKTYRLRISK